MPNGFELIILTGPLKGKALFTGEGARDHAYSGIPYNSAGSYAARWMIAEHTGDNFKVIDFFDPKSRPECDHYWLVRRGGICPHCQRQFIGNFKDV